MPHVNVSTPRTSEGHRLSEHIAGSRGVRGNASHFLEERGKEKKERNKVSNHYRLVEPSANLDMAVLP